MIVRWQLFYCCFFCFHWVEDLVSINISLLVVKISFLLPSLCIYNLIYYYEFSTGAAANYGSKAALCLAEHDKKKSIPVLLLDINLGS